MVLLAVRRVYSDWRYIVISSFLTISITATIFLWANAALLATVWQSEMTSATFKFSLTWQLIVGTPTSMGGMAVVVIGITSLLIGVVTSMIWYAWRSKRAGRELRASFTSSGVGMFAALLGIGCIACGPLLVTSLLALVGGAGLLLVLPLHGAEFGYVALLLLGYAVYTLAKVISAPAICVEK